MERLKMDKYAYYYNDERHTDTSTEYLKALGMDDEGIKSLQDSAAWNAAQNLVKG